MYVCVQYNNGRGLGKSLWNWRYEGNEVDESKKLLGDYDQSTKHAVLKVGSLTVDFGLPKNKWDNEPMVKIQCAGRAFKAFESYPETACGKKPKKQIVHGPGIETLPPPPHPGFLETMIFG